MHFHNVLDKVFSKKSHIRILRFFIRRGKEASIREISREIKITHPNVSLGLADLAEEDILRVKRIGRSMVYSLNKENIFVKKYLTPLFTAEADMSDLLSTVLLPQIKFSYESLILFGSVARKEESAKSDVDLAVIVGAREDKEAVYDQLLALSTDIIRRFGNPLGPVVYHGREFVRLYKKNTPLIREIFKEGRVLSGKSLSEIIIDYNI